MVIRNRHNYSRISYWFSTRIQRISARIDPTFRSRLSSHQASHLAEPLLKYKEGLLGIGFLALSVLLGSWAHTQSQAEAIAKWEKTHCIPIEIANPVQKNQDPIPMNPRSIRNSKGNLRKDPREIVY